MARLRSGGKRQKTGSIRKNIVEPSEPSGILGRGKGRRSLETCLWFQRSMIPDSGILLRLVKCLHVGRFAVLLTVSRSFNITLLQFGKRFFKTLISNKQYKFFCETFRLSLGPEKSKKYACDLLEKEKESFKIWSYKLRHIYKAIDLYKPTFKRYSIVITLLPNRDKTLK